MKVEEAAKLLGDNTNPKELRPFEEEDPFNKGNIVKGFICRTGDSRYGALVISNIGPWKVPQVVFGTPKIPYPFTPDGRWTFPKTREIRVFEKLDGTNILAFSYRGPGKSRYVSFKTRLMPFVGNRGQGDFLTLWRRMLEKYPQIPDLVLGGGHSLSFELYGAMNTHTIHYSNLLDIALLFTIQPDMGQLEPPPRFFDGVPVVSMEHASTNPHDLESYYRRVEEEKQAGLKVLDDGFEGSEGSVWWLSTDEGWKPYKCKPEAIKEIHFASGGPSRAAIRHAAFRAQENVDRLSVEDVEASLLEDFSNEKITARRLAIEKVVNELNTEATLCDLVLNTYEAVVGELGYTLVTNKHEIMREMSSNFPKEQMKKVYRILAIKEGIYVS